MAARRARSPRGSSVDPNSPIIEFVNADAEACRGFGDYEVECSSDFESCNRHRLQIEN
jgi:hypothetical protein